MNNYQNESQDVDLKLIVSAQSNATVTLSNPQTNWTSSYTIQAQQVEQISIPQNQAYTQSAGTIEQRGLLITSTSPISLYASNYYPYSYDATFVLPTSALGKDYIVQVYDDDSFAQEFAVVATENNTQILISPNARTTGNQNKHVPFTVTLNKGETYQVMSEDKSNDFSGTQIHSNKPIAAFTGHVCADVAAPWCDHIVEQLMPVNMWGKQFVVTKTEEQMSNRVVITASKDLTQIKVNGTIVATIGAFNSYEYELTDECVFIETSEPSECYLYITGSKINKMVGDPSCVHISPIEQQVQQLTFATFQSDISRTHYVNIVTTTAGVSSMLLDGLSIASQFHPVPNNPTYQYANVAIAHGTHHITSSNDGFTGYVYGLGWCESYAYSMGSATINLLSGILVDDIPHEDLIYDENRCYLKEIEFSPNVNIEYDAILWKFGDGSTSTQDIVTHQYPAPGTYSIQMIAYKGNETDTAKTTLVLKDTYNDTIYAEICNGSAYVLNEVSYDTPGEYTQSFTSSAGCDSIVTLKLVVHDSYLFQEEHTIPNGSSYKWLNYWCREPGVYRHTLQTVHGCDSIYELTLNVTDSQEEIYDTICWQPTYTFRGIDFTLPSITGYEGQDYLDYTLEVRDKDGCVAYLMNLAISTKQGGTFITNDTIQSGSSYTWRGKQYSETGSYTEIEASGYGCTQEYILNLVVLPFPINKSEATLCTNDSYEFRGKTYTEPGVYRDTVFTDVGIEAIYQLTLTDSRTHEELYITTTGSYTLNGRTYTESGTYVQKLTNAAGCDSILTLYLGIDENCVITTEESRILCPGASFTWNGQTVDEAKDYTSTSASSGCDSIAILHVTAGTAKQTHLYYQICNGDYFRYGADKLTDAQDYIYHYTSAEGCDSVVTLTISHKDTYNTTFKDTIKLGASYTWDGNSYTNAGLYTKGYIAENNCDSIVTLDLFVAEPIYTEFSASTCANVPYIWDGRTYTEANDYSYTYTSRIKGDSIVTLHLSINPILSGDTAATFCKDHSFTWHGTEYSAEGNYPYTYTSKVTGCDSIVTLHLTQLEPTDSMEVVTVCAGSSHIWHGQTFTSSVTKTETINNSVGCDSVCTLKLTVLPELIGDTAATFCKGHPFKWHGVDYPTEGDYPYTYTSKVAPYCDSIVTLHLTQLEPTDSIEYATICEGKTHIWHGNSYTTSTDITETITNAAGCDSVCTLHLKVNPKLSGDTTASVCNGGTFTWWENTYSTANDYTRTFQSQVTGCDSIVTLHLNILPPLATTLNESITEGATYIWNEQTYSEKGTYTQNFTTAEGCDSIVTLNLTVNPLIYDILTHIQCADDPFIEFDITASDGLFHQLQFVFTPKAIAQHYRDTIVDYSASQILIPNSARAGIYDVAVSPLFNNQLLDTRTIQYTLLYPSSVLDQHWDDFIGVLTHNYNGGYDFVGFQWYKNGQPMVGENHSYTYQPLEMGAAYSAMLEEQDGTKLMTCEIIATPQTEISIYPTLLQPHQIMRLHNTINVTIWLYDNLGKLLYTNSFNPGDHQLAAPQTSGVYIIRIQQTGTSGKTDIKKLIVR